MPLTIAGDREISEGSQSFDVVRFCPMLLLVVGGPQEMQQFIAEIPNLFRLDSTLEKIFPDVIHGQVLQEILTNVGFRKSMRYEQRFLVGE